MSCPLPARSPSPARSKRRPEAPAGPQTSSRKPQEAWQSFLGFVFIMSAARLACRRAGPRLMRALWLSLDYLSMMREVPMPPPMQRVARPYLESLLIIS